MKTLKELVVNQDFLGMSDMQVITTYLSLNDLEEEGIELIYELTKSKIEKLKRRQRIVQEWTSYLPSEYLYKNYPLDIADGLHRLELDYISNGYELSKYRMEWARENVPNIENPRVYFQPLVEFLRKNDIKFTKRGENNNE